MAWRRWTPPKTWCKRLQRSRPGNEGVLGFVVRRSQNGKVYWTIAGSTGLLIPVRDVAGRIVVR
jgi:hypothetical protein